MNLPMKTFIQIAALFCLLAFLFVACNRTMGSKTVEIQSKNFEEEISRTENLSFTFSQNLSPDSLLMQWDSTAYIQFNPPINGRFRWTNANTLVFSPFEPFAPNSAFSGKLTKEVLRHTKNEFKLSANNTFNFHTPDIDIKSVNAYWKKSAATNKPVLAATIKLLYPTDPKSFAEYLKASINGSNRTFTLLNTAPSEEMNIEFADFQPDEDDISLSVSVEPGMPVLGANQPSKKELTGKSDLQSITVLTINSLEATHDGAEGRIDVITSQQVASDNLRQVITITPAVPFDVETYGSGFSIVSSAFDMSQTYQLSIANKLTGIFGGKMSGKYNAQIAFGEVEPTVEFVNRKAMYLSNRAYKNIAVRMVNVKEVKITIAKVFENNIMTFMRQGQQYGYESNYDAASDDYDYHEYNYYDTENYGQTVWEKTYKTSQLEALGKINLLHLDFEDKLPQFNGVYIIQVQDTERKFITDSKIVCYSDIGLIAKNDGDQVHVFVNTISDAKPLPGAEISFISRNNQVLHTAVSNEQGVAVLPSLKSKYPDFKIAMISARKDGDYSFMLFDQTNVNTARYDVGGRRANPANYEAFIYGERDMYRPGETIHAAAIVRTSDAWATPKNVPVKLKLLLPNGKEYKTIGKTLNSDGACQADFDVPANMVTGTYTLELYTGNDILLNSKSISVEEFMPDRIKVEVNTDSKEVKPGQSVLLQGKATNLFGPPAANRNYEVTMNLNRKPFVAKDFPNYIFNITDEHYFEQVVAQGKTNESGTFAEKFDINPEYADMGVLSGKLFATVFDESGRPVYSMAPFDVYTQDVFYGIADVGGYVSTRTPVDIPLVAVDKAGKATSAKAHLEIVRFEWRTVMQSVGGSGRYRYESQRQEITEVSQDINISGKNFIYKYKPVESGEYELRLSRPGSSTTKGAVVYGFYAYRYGDTQSTSFEVNQEGTIDIEFDKESYQAGQTANVLLKAPFEGRMLVTVERDKVLRYLFVNTDKKVAKIDLQIPDEYVPNVFVAATLIRPAKELSVPLTVAHGYASIAVENAKNKLPVKVIANETTRAKTKQKILVETTPNTELAIAVVDEGILQIKDYKTPDPYNFFYQRRALEVESFDIYPYLFPEIMAGGMLSGGDGYNLNKRINPVTAKRAKLVTYWSGLIKSNSAGKAEFVIDIPQFSGDLRAMAVAYKDKSFGSADTHIKVADPVVVSTGLPRFLSPGDTITVPVTLTNTTKNSTQAKVTIAANNFLSVVGSNSTSLSLNAGAENRAEFKVVAKPDIGVGKITVSADAMGETFTEETEIAVRPPASLQKISNSGSIQPGQAQTINMENNYLPNSIDAQLLLSRSPLMELAGGLEYLVEYPYGCVEQTISVAFPQIYYYDIAKNIGKTPRTALGATNTNPNFNVQEAIKKLESMQLANGGMAYWPGGDEESWWGSIFAAHFLMEAQKAGFEVKETTIDNLFAYMQKRLNKKETYKYKYYDSANKLREKEIACKEIPYTLYVLASAGKPAIPLMNYYKAKPDALSLDGRYLLAAAFALSGDKTKFAQTLPPSFSGEVSQPEFDGSFASPIRDKAIALNVLMEADPNNAQIGALSKQLVSDFKKQRWHNTQECVFTFLALGKVARQNADSDVQATVSANGKTIASFTGKDLKLNYADFKANNLQISTTGKKGNLYYFWNMEGLSADGKFVQEDSYLKVRKRFFDRNGKELTKLNLKQNDLVVIQLSLQSTGSGNVPNVVVTDMLPAGFEIENPRIGELPDMPWVKDATLPQHQDIRDDRINLFTTAENKSKNFYYVVRAVSPGRFRMGPAAADAMYNGEYHSYNGAATVLIAAR
ncbi:alpha-2-macroglobulin [Sphingobacteriales bacterium UPWRP_1]|nr:hypothetical protein B6N25_05180 [Sphingobacteriales bacterium TSM_CSS]PSJ77687.1 alpha-2-macroglobulin [Sphingobacteriales bacterium UPWRP_1]